MLHEKLKELLSSGMLDELEKVVSDSSKDELISAAKELPDSDKVLLMQNLKVDISAEIFTALEPSSQSYIIENMGFDYFKPFSLF